jgi:hypothetical protein
MPVENCALVIGHPGHELRVHHWLERARPLVFALTDGSGRTAHSRLPSTLAVLARAGARPGAIFGRLSDAEAYSIIADGNIGPLLEIIRELAGSFQEHEINLVVADALEGYNPSHDLCRYLTNMAVLVAEQSTGRSIQNYDFLLVGHPGLGADEPRSGRLTVELDEAALARKLAAAENYSELKAELDAAIARFGTAPFRQEVLRPVALDEGLNGLEVEPPFYETYGEQQVAAGHYKQVIRYRSHMLPFIHRLRCELGLAA